MYVCLYTRLFRFSKTYINDKTVGKAKRLHAEQSSYYNCFEVILQFFNDLMSRVPKSVVGGFKSFRRLKKTLLLKLAIDSYKNRPHSVIIEYNFS